MIRHATIIIRTKLKLIKMFICTYWWGALCDKVWYLSVNIHLDNMSFDFVYAVGMTRYRVYSVRGRMTKKKIEAAILCYYKMLNSAMVEKKRQKMTRGNT